MKLFFSILLSLGMALGTMLSYAENSDCLDKKHEQAKEKLKLKGDKKEALKDRCDKHACEKKSDDTDDSVTFGNFGS